MRGGSVVSGRWHMQCLKDCPAEQAELVDCFIFQETVLQIFKVNFGNF